jgi:outer membrane protein OmpA-like peptidoglycan-associated protein
VVDELKKDNLKVGDILRVDELYFKADSDEMETSSLEVLDEIARILQDRQNIRKVEIAGHTNGLPPTYYCEQLSSARAKRVYDYLVSKSIAKDRLISKGYGKRDPIASDDTPEGRRKNQRVEIKILEME